MLQVHSGISTFASQSVTFPEKTIQRSKPLPPLPVATSDLTKKTVVQKSSQNSTDEKVNWLRARPVQEQASVEKTSPPNPTKFQRVDQSSSSSSSSNAEHCPKSFPAKQTGTPLTLEGIQTRRGKPSTQELSINPMNSHTSSSSSTSANPKGAPVKKEGTPITLEGLEKLFGKPKGELLVKWEKAKAEEKSAAEQKSISAKLTIEPKENIPVSKELFDSVFKQKAEVNPTTQSLPKARPLPPSRPSPSLPPYHVGQSVVRTAPMPVPQSTSTNSQSAPSTRPLPAPVKNAHKINTDKSTPDTVEKCKFQMVEQLLIQASVPIFLIKHGKNETSFAKSPAKVSVDGPYNGIFSESEIAEYHTPQKAREIKEYMSQIFDHEKLQESSKYGFFVVKIKKIDHEKLRNQYKDQQVFFIKILPAVCSLFERLGLDQQITEHWKNVGIAIALAYI